MTFPGPWLRAAKEARERRASQGVGAPPRGGHAAAPSGSRGVIATLANLPASAEQEDRCAICGGEDVPGVNELKPCGFGERSYNLTALYARIVVLVDQHWYDDHEDFVAKGPNTIL